MNAALEQLEQSVIGAVFLRPENLALLPSLGFDDFATYRGKTVWCAIRNLENAGRPIDTVTVGDELGREGKLNTIN